ncbi:TIGR01777 family oxidoreductase [Thiopseudomonas denitrificans]|uniref:TIGR01777 family protein n=1 Tax=Thiopseudomonas denitrificans TaxID=1501432 RepID=A0A4R6U559_9GAMM|nr:TIGR01777 family oxidoreductase [Thiopseudomonas denitrificans]TDQ38164.1 hypothetical protein DFQ45_10575 [Thiopseudomonas denitrificans]
MQILLTGGTGLVGRALCRHFSQQGHSLIVLSRDPGKVAGLCSGARGIGSLEELNVTDAVDAVINLAGAPIADRPWTKGRRRMLRESRIDLTRNLVDWMSRRDQAPGVLLSASATGWYGDRGEEQLDETSAAPVADFASQLCQDWEAEVMRAAELGTRVACLRFAPVLAADGGMLARLLPVFRLGLGGRLGSGQQWMPWIHLDDLVRLFDHLLSNDSCQGIYNACSPMPVRNAEFTRILAQTVRRPAIFPAPAWLLRLALGEMSILLTGGQHVMPKRTADSGFDWQYPELSAALQQLLHKPA